MSAPSLGIVKLLPEGIVRELAYTGRKMSAVEAHRLGLANEVYATQEELLENVMEVAREIATKAPLAVYGSKKIITYSRDHDTKDTLNFIRIWNASMLQRDEIAEAITANSEKREGQFTELPPLPKSYSGDI